MWCYTINKEANLSEFGPGLFLLHPAMGNQVVKHLSYIIQKPQFSNII